MRGSLDHCVKCTICETFCPVSNVTPLFPGPKYVGPAGRALPRRRRAVARRVARLLLGLRHLHPGLPAGRAHRRDQHAGAREAARRRRASSCATGCSRGPTLLGPARHAGGAARQLDAAQPAAAAARSRRLVGHPPRRARCRSSPGRTFQRWARKHHARRAAARRVAFFHGCGTNYYEPRARRDDRRAARAQRLRGRGAQAGLLRAAAAVQRPVRRRAAATCTGWRARLAPYAREGVDIVGTSTSCTLMLKREALEILGMERRPGPARRVRARLRHLRVPARRCTSAASCSTDFAAACRRPSPTTRRASSRATGSASRRSTCWRSIPELRVDRERRDAAAASPAPTG